MARAQPVGDTEPANPVDVLCAVGQHCAAESGEGLANTQLPLPAAYYGPATSFACMLSSPKLSHSDFLAFV